jgi:hypothetical protein
MLSDIKAIKMFKVMECSEVEKYQDRDDPALQHLHGAVTVSFTVAGTDLDVFELFRKFPAVIACEAENSDNFVWGKYTHNILLFILKSNSIARNK